MFLYNVHLYDIVFLVICFNTHPPCSLWLRITHQHLVNSSGYWQGKALQVSTIIDELADLMYMYLLVYAVSLLFVCVYVHVVCTLFTYANPNIFSAHGGSDNQGSTVHEYVEAYNKVRIFFGEIMHVNVYRVSVNTPVFSSYI